MSLPMNNLGGNMPLNNSSNFGSLPSGPENSNKVGDTNMYAQPNANPVDYMQNQDYGNSGIPMDGFHNNSYMYLNEVHNNEPMTMLGQPGDVSQGQGDLNSRIPSYQLQFNPVAGGTTGAQGTSISSAPLLSGGVASKQPLHHNLTNTDSFVSVQLQGGGMMHQPGPGSLHNSGVGLSHSGPPSMHGSDMMLPRMGSNVPGSQPLLSDQQNWRSVNGMASGGPQGGPPMMSLPQMNPGGVNGVQGSMGSMSGGAGGGPAGPQSGYQMGNPMMQMGGVGGPAGSGMHGQHPGSHQQMPPQQQQQMPPSQSGGSGGGGSGGGGGGGGGSFVGNKLAPKDWHRSEQHQIQRNLMVEEIIKLLKTRRPNASDDWHEKLPHMAKRLEDALYHDANCLEDYMDANTLKARLQQLALSMGGNTNKAGKSGGSGGGAGGGGSSRQPNPQQQQQMQQQQGGGNPNYTAVGNQPQLQQQYHYQQMQYQQQMQQQQQQQMQQQQQQYGMNPNQYGNNGTQQYQQHYPNAPNPNQRQGSGPGNAGGVSQHQMYPGQQQQQPQGPGNFNPNNGYGPQGGMDYSQMGMQQQPQGAGGHQGMGGMMGNPNMMYGGGGMMIDQQQQGGGHSGDMMGGYGMNGQQQQAQNQNQRGSGGNAVYGGGNMMQGGPSMGGGQYGVPGGPMDDGSYNNNMMMMNRGGPMNQQNPHQMGNQMAPSHPNMMQPMQNNMGNPMVGGGGGQVVNGGVGGVGGMQGLPQGGGGGGGNGHSDEHRKQVLKQQQQRLLLLRHASKCPHDNGRCPVTPHCWSMKVLWKHIMSCKDQECKVPHCVSSRYVLSHYSKCKEQSCPVCGPVREAIKRNYERSRDVVKMARNPNAPAGAGYGNQYGGNMQQAPSRDEPPAKKQKMDKKGKNETTTLTITQPPQLKLNIRQKNVYPLDPISCAIYSFTSEQINAHFKTIQEGMKLTVAKIKEMCKPIMDELLKIPHAYGVFGTPVDPVALNLPDYFDVVKIPMDLGTVMKRLDSGSYRDTHNFVVDVHLTFDNAMNYNPKNSDVYILAKSLKKDFDSKYRAKITEFENALESSRCSPDSCLICGEVSLKFEPPVYYCNGTCAQRIRRNATFYSNATNTYHWCSSCFNALRENETIRLPDCTITRGELLRGKKKHTEESEEGWVQCEGGCQRWVHQVCSLFNARRNVSDEVSYVCPVCIQEKRRKNPDQIIVAPTTKKMRAVDLPVSVLSQFLEKRIYDRLEIAYHENAEKLGCSVNDVEKCPPLCLRQVACLDKMHTVREGVFNRYKDKNYPTDFPCRTKCLVLFQNIDGQDVILFGMYVYEYGHKCPQPNQRRVYISYLDSVHYLRPKQYRTLVYHEILVSYLDYVRARGFHTAHIWACPPQKGDDYILYVHPSDQKTPKPQILRVWYDEMLKAAKERGIVHEITDLHTEYLVDHSNDATVLPYFEGDYWVNEAEVIIKDLSEGGRKSNTSAAANNDDDDDDEGTGAVGGAKSKRKQKTKRPTRTTSKPALGKSDRDPVMAKLASIIEPMKDTFFVARLHPKEYAEKFAELRNAEIKAEASENTTESNTAREKQLQEEALSGTEVNMPVIPAEEKPETPAGEQQGQSGSGGGSGGDENDSQEDDEDDFGRIAASVGENEASAGTTGGDNAMDVAMERDNEEDKEFGEAIAANPLSAAVSQTNLTLDTAAANAAAAGENTVGSAYSAASTPTTRSGRTRKNGGEDATPAVEMSMKVDAEPAVGDAAAANAGAESSNGGDAVTVVTPTATSGNTIVASSDAAPAATGVEITASSDVVIKVDPASTMVKTESGLTGETESGMQVVKAESETDADTVALLARLRKSIQVGENLPKLTDDTEDVDDVQENEHFDTRQSFLNLCQGNHYQFDQLRRAKHTSMMVLYHLHNPDAPKFVPSCSACHADILTGYRYHCESCEIDYCQSCFQANGGRIHHHPLRPINTSNSAPTQLTEEQRRERQRSVQLHMQLLQHAANCTRCESKNCLRMKEFLKHDSTCTVKVNGGCRLCARISNLLNIHARTCRVENCLVPHCLELREQIRKLTLRQQQMDDRRRKKFNSEYNRGSAPAAADEE